jgi:hypothetical protein
MALRHNPHDELRNIEHEHPHADRSGIPGNPTRRADD